jgi:hypothetical protein
MNKEQFEYGGYHFIPERRFNQQDGDFFSITRKLNSDRELGFFAADYNNGQKFPYSYDDFYAASTDKKCDVFRCVENGKLYVPCQYELQQYRETPDKVRRDTHER